MGLVSFLTYLFVDTTGLSSSSSGEAWVVGLEFSDVVCFFIAVSFVVQALFFVNVIPLYARRIQQLEFTSPVEILACHEELRASSSLLSLGYEYFLRAPLWLQLFLGPRSQLSLKMEMQLLSQYFKAKHGLPPAFNFATYVTDINRLFIMGLSEVTPLSWVVIAVLVGANYVKIFGLDRFINRALCSGQSDATGECWEAKVAAIIGYGVIIVLYMAALLVCTITSLDRLLRVVLEHFHLELGAEAVSTRVNGRYLLQKYLCTLGKALGEGGEILSSSTHAVTFQNALSCLSKELGVEAVDGEEKSESEHSPINSRGRTTSVAFFAVADPTINSEAHTTSISECTKRTTVGLAKGLAKFLMGNPRKRVRACAEDYYSIFIFSSPYLYFQSIELGLLLQCVYMALVTTQYSVIVGEELNGRIGLIFVWEILILLPLLACLLLTHFILFYASILKAVTFWDRGLCRRILTDLKRKSSVHKKLRDRIVDYLSKSRKRNHLFLDTVAEDSEVGDTLKEDESTKMRKDLITLFKERAGMMQTMNRRQFGEFLRSMKIGFKREALDEIFNSMDVDRSGDISWKEVALVCFPFSSDAEYAHWEAQHVIIEQERDHLREYRRSSILGYFFGLFPAAPSDTDVGSLKASENDQSAAPVLRRRSLSQNIPRLQRTQSNLNLSSHVYQLRGLSKELETINRHPKNELNGVLQTECIDDEQDEFEVESLCFNDV